MNYGIKVTAVMGSGSIIIFRNVTEIHYRYQEADKVIFESDIHSTGYTCYLSGAPAAPPQFVVEEFWTTPETEIAEEM